ncbi:MAG: hypothetical protein UY63_C0005G0082 [Parcubacteria group bacterium GW2011_GWA2_51_10]|nr:MAG: hypothetical protein UY63_C0005G0082 [Parcubacteria group bacterium GW2011_GWA2_51_10]
MFRDRRDAGEQLAKKLEKYRGTGAVLLALPRGGVVLASSIARSLGLPLDIAIVRKIGHPGNPEYAAGAVDENGTTLWNESAKAFIDPQWLKGETERQMNEAKRRSALYRAGKPALPLASKVVILIDDGAATGLSMRLAVKVVEKQNPARVVVALPVAAEDTAQSLSQEADELVMLEPPAEFLGAVGAHYDLFPQVEDEEVIELLRSR